jgi:hypothetical protein
MVMARKLPVLLLSLTIGTALSAQESEVSSDGAFEVRREMNAVTSIAAIDLFHRPGSVAATRTAPSRAKVFFRSFLIPGWGQRTAGARTSARTFFTAELALWAGFTAFQVRGRWLENDYQLFAETHAGLQAEGKAKRYFVDVGNYDDIDAYNEAKLRNRDVAALYDRQSYYWQWDSDANRRRFDSIRVRSESAYTNSGFIIAGVLANHVISGIHAVYLAGRRERKQEQGEVPSPRFHVESSSRDIRLGARVQF